MSEEQKEENQRRIKEIAGELGRAKKIEPIAKAEVQASIESPTIGKSQAEVDQEEKRRALLKEQAKALH